MTLVHRRSLAVRTRLTTSTSSFSMPTAAPSSVSASSTPSERVEIPLLRQPNDVTVQIVPFLVLATNATLTISLEDGVAPGPDG